MSSYKSETAPVNSSNAETVADPVLPDQGGRMTPADPVAADSENHEETVRQRAYELYQQRGGRDGHAQDDWFRAKAEVVQGRLTASKAAN